MNILDALEIKIPNGSIARVLKNFHLPARQEIIQKNPTVIIDGAHNNDKLANLAEFIKTIPHRKLHLVFGIARDKRYGHGLKKLLALSPNDTYLYATRFLTPFRAAEDPRRIAANAKKYFRGQIKMFIDPRMALQMAHQNAGKKDLMVVTGSFFLAGELRIRWVPEKNIVPTSTII